MRPFENNPITAACVEEIGGVRLGVTGRFSDEDLGVSCYHSKVGCRSPSSEPKVTDSEDVEFLR